MNDFVASFDHPFRKDTSIHIWSDGGFVIRVNGEAVLWSDVYSTMNHLLSEAYPTKNYPNVDKSLESEKEVSENTQMIQG